MISYGWPQGTIASIDYGNIPGTLVIVVNVPMTGDVYPREMPHISLSEFKWRDEPWLAEVRQTPRRTKRGLPAFKPAPVRHHRRGCY